MRALPLALLVAASAAAGEELTPQTVGQVQYEQDKAEAKIAKDHGNKKPSEMSDEERAQYIQEEQAARQTVLDKHGLDDKAYSRYEALLPKDDRGKVEAERKRLADKEKAEANKKPAPKEIIIQRGFNNANPVDVEGGGGEEGEPTVERGLPPDAPDVGPAEKPAHKSKSHHKKKKSADY